MRVIKRIGIPILIVFLLASLFSCLPKQSVSFNSAHVCEVSSEVKEAYNEAIASICVLDEKIIEQINVAFQRQDGMPLCLNDYAEVLGERLSGTFCYGNFDNCIVIFSPTDLQAMGTITVADEVFTHSKMFNLWGYCDGVFYSLSEAYEKGYITKEEVSEVAERHRAIERYNSLCTIYHNAQRALKALDGEVKDSIVNAFKVNGVTAEWLDLDKKTMFTSSHLRSYGDYNGCIVLLLTTQNPDDNVKTIADRTFESSGVGISMWGYYKGALYDLQDAYDRGFIIQSDIGVAVARHNDVEHYIEMIIEN